MHGANGHYGHRELLNNYCGVALGTPLPALLQHGWNHDLGAALADVQLPMPAPFLAWNERNVAHARRADLHHVVGIGAPLLYLPEDPALPPQEPGSLLAIPVHGWERAKVQQELAGYAQELAAIADQFSTITVCLYWFDHQFAENRKAFEDRGMRVVCVGHRDNNPRFLFDLRTLCARHAHVTSNRVQTGLFVAMYLGCRPFLYGSPVGVEPILDHGGHLWDAWQRRVFAQLAWERFAGDTQRELGASELGLPLRKSPDELRSLLLWSDEQRAQLRAAVQQFQVRTHHGWRRMWIRWRGPQIPRGLNNRERA